MSWSCIILCIALIVFPLCCRWLSPLDRRVPTMSSMTPMKSYTIFRSARQAKPPLFISIQSHSLAPALFYCIRTTTIQLLHVAVVEPLSCAWPVIATVNRAGVREWDCIGMNKGFLLAWHFWRWYSSSSVSLITSSKHTSTEGEQSPANTERIQSMQCTIWCMIMTCQYDVFWANATKTRVVWDYLNQRLKYKPKLWTHISALSCFI